MIKSPPEIGENTSKFLNRITAWISEISQYPGFHEWQQIRMQRVLTHHLVDDPEVLPNFEFDADTLKKHNFAISYMELIQAATALRDTEFYFRRYPFTGLSITESDHIGYVCDMLFSRIYQFKSKMKMCLNLKDDVQKTRIDIGRTVKYYEKVFKEDLASRNKVHHHARYEDIDTQQISMANLMLIGSPDGIWSYLKSTSYRRVRHGWVQRTRHRARAVFEILDSISATFDAEIDFLPPSKT